MQSGLVYHQGKVYEASAYAVPFLFERLAFDQMPDKPAVANLLAVLADGHSYLEAHASIEWLRPLIEKQLAAEGREWEREVERERHWVKATREAGGRELERLYPYLHHADGDLRMALVRCRGALS